jgi:hypothetical protein
LLDRGQPVGAQRKDGQHRPLARPSDLDGSMISN